ncbi:hypothetical protein ACSX1A_10780 [Pontibacter sp. MBLB2868]|uniref:hypothetical protein n=1 Tax=Pontibacter sp. MBLB2868 TaxID=3451555 RepID=UPI003F74F0FD
MRKQLVESVAEINVVILTGKALETFQIFYTPNVVMQEIDNENIFGKGDSLLRQQEFFSNITSFNEAEVKSVSLAENRRVVKWFQHYKRKKWEERKFHQVGVQQRQRREMTHEKFYYGSSVYSPK